MSAYDTLLGRLFNDDDLDDAMARAGIGLIREGSDILVLLDDEPVAKIESDARPKEEGVDQGALAAALERANRAIDEAAQALDGYIASGEPGDDYSALVASTPEDLLAVVAKRAGQRISQF